MSRWSAGLAIILLVSCAKTPSGYQVPVDVSVRTVDATANTIVKPISPVFNSRALSFLGRVATDDLEGYFSDKETLLDWGGLFSLSRVRSEQISEQYHTNEVAGDEKYRDKWLLVIGTVDGVKKDLADKVYVVLRGNRFLHDVHAYLNPPSYRLAGALAKGEVSSLVCRGSGMSLVPVLRSCDLKQVAFRAFVASASAIISAWFSQGKPPPFSSKDREALFRQYVVGTILHKASPCHTVMNEACTRDMAALKIETLLSAPAVRQELRKIAVWLGLGLVPQ